MSAIDQYIERITDKGLQEQIRREVDRLLKKKSFGLVFEHHMPDNLLTPEVPIRRGTNVVIRNKSISDVYEVQNLTETEATCIQLSSMNEVVLPLNELVAVAQRGDVIYPYLKPMDSVKNAPDSELWHTLIEADNYHALQLLVYLYAGQVDCIYIDPPYNKPDSHDWKYNCDYVDGNDSYRHSKWLSMIEARLKIAKKLLNPNDSVLIVAIDELEYHHLACLLEQIFPESEKRIQMVSCLTNSRGVARENGFARVDEFLFIVQFGSSSVNRLQLSNEWRVNMNANDKRISHLRWSMLIRSGSHFLRSDSENQFYPVFITNDGRHIHSVGEPYYGSNREEVIAPDGTFAVWPIRQDGNEGNWQISNVNLRILIKRGFVMLGKKKGNKVPIYYLKKGEITKVENGVYEIQGRREDGSIISDTEHLAFIPGTQWRIASHDASIGGTKMLKDLGLANRFSFPKSLYAVHDTIRFFVSSKPDALILDFFAGSGTTLHAVNLLNAEDGGHRRCIMVTNNEIGETKEKELLPQGIYPGDEKWEKWGIARYVNWPRTKCSILGVDVNNNPIEGDYITSNSEIKELERRFTQINFLPLGSGQKQKKALVALINKQKDVKLPTMAEDVPFLVSEDDKCNASILFDVSKIDDYLEALEGNDHITNFFIVTDKDAVYKKVKEEVSQLMGKIEETVPVSMPMKDGFKANAAFFKLGFLDKKSVARGRQLKELLPVLWMKAGAKGECPKEIEGDYVIWPNNHIAILRKESCFRQFRKELENHSEIEVVYIITDSQNAYLAMIDELRGYKTYQLYRDYLENFRINYAIK